MNTIKKGNKENEVKIVQLEKTNYQLNNQNQSQIRENQVIKQKYQMAQKQNDNMSK